MTIRARHITYLLMTALSALMLINAAACDARGQDTNSALRVFAASSLTEAMLEAAERFEVDNNGVAVETHFAGSSRLRAQLEAGAQADVFISADLRHINAIPHLIDPAAVRMIAANELVVVLSDSAKTIPALQALSEPGVKIVMALPDVPAGRYARDLLADVSQQDGFPADFAEAVLANVVSEEANVRAVLAKVQLGEADAGFVYRSDLGETGLSSLTIPGQDPGDIAYVGVVLDDSPHHATAQVFLDFLLSEAGQRVLTSHGLLAPDASLNGGRVAAAMTP